VQSISFIGRFYIFLEWILWSSTKCNYLFYGSWTMRGRSGAILLRI